MKKPLILVFGKNGQVGYELSMCLQFIGQVLSLDSYQADFRQPLKIRQILQQYKPDIVINAVAYTAVDKAESEAKLAICINAQTPAEIARYCQENSALMVHYSTDFVFDGTLDRAYNENDKTNPLGVYGCSKLAGDEAILDSNANALIFRTSWVYGMRGKNFLLTMLRLAHQREELKVVDDQQGSPVWCRHIAQTSGFVLQQLLAEYKNLKSIDPEKLGLFNLTAANYTSWAGFANKLLSFDKQKSEQKCSTTTPITTEQYPTPAARPKWSVLDNSRLATTYKLDIPSWEEQLQLCMS